MTDAGIGLVELIVYLAMALVVTLGIATMFVSGVNANNQTKDRDAATGQAQVISSSIQNGIRNASDFTVIDDLLRARVAIGPSDWQCEAWAITADGGFVHRTSTTAIAEPSDYADWTTLAANAQGTLIDGRAFAMSGNRLEAGLKIIVGQAAVSITADTVAQAKGEGSPDACW